MAVAAGANPSSAALTGWRDWFESRRVSAEEAIAHVKSGDRVAFSYGREPIELGMALVARAHELQDITIFDPVPGRDFGWYEDWGHPFSIEYEMCVPVIRKGVEEHRFDQAVSSIFGASERPVGGGEADVLLVEVSTPDEHGFCSLGASVWDKQDRIRGAAITVASVNPKLIRTGGENYVHVSEIDCFVDHVPSGREPASVDLLGRKPTDVPTYVETIGNLVAGEILRDGDTLEVGVGLTSESVARSEAICVREDLGWHSEATPRGIIRLVMDGVITGKRKTLHRGKAVCTSIGGGTKEEMNFVNGNPLFELYPNKYATNPIVIAQNANMVAINSAVAVDLTGQVTAETLGRRQISTAGGQTPFAYGALLSEGGRNVVVLPSTASGGEVSRIMPEFPAGTTVTQTRALADLVVSEHGIARLRGKTVRERALELVAICDPRFRDELRAAAQELYW
jgi:4-hydroxybutyrate CoA-transferase